MNRKLWMIVVVASVLGVLALAVAGSVWAAEASLPQAAIQRDEVSAEAEARALRDHVVRGTVTDLDGDRVSVETSEGLTATLLLTDTTRFWVPGEAPTTTVVLAVGDPVLALGRPVPGGTEARDRTLATWLVVVVADEDLPKVAIRGRAVAVTEQTIVVQTGRCERAITVLPRTIIISPQGRLDSLREIRPGERIFALGQPTELGQWFAGLVLAPGP